MDGVLEVLMIVGHDDKVQISFNNGRSEDFIVLGIKVIYTYHNI